MNPVIESIVNIVVDNVIDLGTEKIKQSLETVHRKQILKAVCDKFYYMLYRVSEYPTLAYSNKLIDSDTLTEEDINPALKAEEIAEHILPVIRKSFVTDEESDYIKISKMIAHWYKQCALITVSLSDISVQLQKVGDQTLEELKTIQDVQKKNQEMIERNNLKKDHVYQEYVQFRVNDFVASVVKGFYSLIFKEPLTAMGNEDMVKAGLKSIHDKVENNDKKLWDTEFWRSPIRILVPAENSFIPKEETIEPKEFIENKVVEWLGKIDEVMQYKDTLPDLVYYKVLKFDSAIRQDLNFRGAISLGRVFTSANMQKEDVHRMLTRWCDLVLDLEDLYKTPARA